MQKYTFSIGDDDRIGPDGHIKVIQVKKGRTLMSEGFYVRFLGGFSLNFAGQEIFLKANPLRKTMQLLYFLLKAGSKGREKEELLNFFFGRKE